MIDLSRYQGKRIGVVGLGKTGLSAVYALKKFGAFVFAWDDNETKRQEVSGNCIDILDLEKDRVDFLLWSPGIAHYGDKAHPLSIQAKQLNIPLVCDIELFVNSVPNDILAVTGTNGKSTTTALLAHTLSQFRPCLMGGNIGATALDLEMLPENGVYVLELSSYQLELTPSLKAKGAVLLNITPDHLARHGDMKTYVAAKEKIFQGNKGVAVISIDSDITMTIAERLASDTDWKVVPVSTTREMAEGVYARVGKLYDNEQVIFDFADASSLKGQHSHENAACAYALIRQVYGYEPQRITDAMKSFGGLPHRQYLVKTIGNISYINDSKATNAEAAAKALSCMDNIYWILGGQAKEGGLTGLDSYMNRVRHAFLIGEAANEFAFWLKQRGVDFTQCGTLEKAVREAHRLAQDSNKQAVVLLSPACASWDQFQSFEHRGNVFSQLVEQIT